MKKANITEEGETFQAKKNNYTRMAYIRKDNKLFYNAVLWS